MTKVGTGSALPLFHAEVNQLVDSRAWGRLVSMGDDAVEPLIARLGDEDSGIREGIVLTLGGIKDSRAVEPLTEIVAGPKKPWFLQLPKCMRSICCWRENEISQGSLYRDSDPRVRVEAVHALDKFDDDTRIMEALLTALKDPHPFVRGAAVFGLPKYSDSDDRRILKALLNAAVKDKASEVRTTSATSIREYYKNHVEEDPELKDILGSRHHDAIRTAWEELCR